MLIQKKFYTIRHFEDANTLRSSGFDAPLVKNNQKLIDTIQRYFIVETQKGGIKHIRLYTPKKKRTLQTSKLLRRAFEDKHILTDICIDNRLENINQGLLKLPEEYIDGDHFRPLEEVWPIFWHNTFEKKDLLYKFGISHKKHFIQPGNTYAETVEGYYSFLASFLDNIKLQDDTLHIIIGHSICLNIFFELEYIAKDMATKHNPLIIPEGDLPFATSEYFHKLKSQSLLPKQDFGGVRLHKARYMLQTNFIQLLKREVSTLRKLILGSR